MKNNDASHGHADQAGPWSDVLDFVDRLAASLDLSGWSLGIAADGVIHTYSRGFSAETCGRYAALALDAALPGPATLREHRNQYFPTSEDAHRRYPDSAGVDGGTQHDAAATLVLWRDEPVDAAGYLALHFARPHSFGAHERRQLERLAASIAAGLPRLPTSVDEPAVASASPAADGLDGSWVDHLSCAPHDDEPPRLARRGCPTSLRIARDPRLPIGAGCS